MLIFAFYARKNTLAPALVGVLSVVVYLLIAFLLVDSLGLYSLMIADSIKHMTHAAVMAILLHREIGKLHDGIRSTTGKSLLASLVMGAIVLAILKTVPGSNTLPGRLLIAAGGGLCGFFSYVLVVDKLRVPAARLIIQMVKSRIRGGAN